MGILLSGWLNATTALADCQGNNGNPDALNGWDGTSQADSVLCDNDPSTNPGGTVQTGNGNDTITLDGATLQKIDAGNDDDTINLDSGRLLGNVIGGGGHDPIALKGAIIDFDIEGGDTFTLDGANVERIGGGSGNNTFNLLTRLP